MRNNIGWEHTYASIFIHKKLHLIQQILIFVALVQISLIVYLFVMMGLYLLSTDHLEKELWFREEEDFKAAMNYIAIQAACHPEIVVFAFILMSNHIHLILKGTPEGGKEFMNGLKQRYSKYIRYKYGIVEFLRRNAVDVKYIPYENEAPEKAIAYVQMNCVAANICLYPGQYPWGTGNIFFNRTVSKGTRIGEMSERARFRLFHTGCKTLPEDWLINDDGYILPQSYVDVKAVETVFRTPKRMIFFQQTSSKARKRLESVHENLPAFRDQSILLILPDLCRSLFQKECLEDLSAGELLEMARQLRFRFSANVHQVARVCRLTYTEAARLFECE